MKHLRRTAARLYDGGGPALWELGGRLLSGSWRDRGIRAAISLAGLWVWWRTLNVWPWLTGVLFAAFAIKAWRAADREEDAEEQQAAADEAREMLLDEVYLRLLVRLIGDEPGIHLERLGPELGRVDERLAALTRPELRDLLGVLGVPVRRSLRVGARTGVPGVHRDDALQALRDYLARGSSPEE